MASNFNVTLVQRQNKLEHSFVIDGVRAPRLILVAGNTYTFSVNTPGHPFYITTHAIGGTSKQEGMIPEAHQTQGPIEHGTITFHVDSSHVGESLYYQCDTHKRMGTRIIVRQS